MIRLHLHSDEEEEAAEEEEEKKEEPKKKKKMTGAKVWMADIVLSNEDIEGIILHDPGKCQKGG